MFDFKNGMLGVVIIALAIAGALFGSYLAGIETEQVEVTKYDYLADVSGLFEYDQSPQYIEFDPSTNYTGYYSDESYADNKYYFAENQVDFTSSPNVNNYRIDLKPTLGEIRTVDISTITDSEDNPLPTTSDTYRLTYVADTNSDNTYWRGHPVLLSDVIANMTYGEGTTELRFTTSDVDWNGTHTGSGVNSRMSLDTVLFVPSSWLTYQASGMYWGAIVNPSIDPTTISITGGAKSPIQSMKIDITTRSVKAYSDDSYADLIQTFDATSILVFSGDDPYQQMSPKLNLGDFTFQEVQTKNVYLDPNMGVWLKDEE